MIECNTTLDDARQQGAPAFEPATILVTASPVAGKEAEWEQALSDLISASRTFPGYLGTTVLKPELLATPTYRIITKWENNENVRHWRESDERQQHVARLSMLETKPADIQHVTGLETWFDLPHHGEPHAIVPPPQYKMAVIVWIAVFFAVVPLINILKMVTAELPPLVSSAIGVTASVVSMTWIVMPVLSWVFRSWLYPASKRGALLQGSNK